VLSEKSAGKWLMRIMGEWLLQDVLSSQAERVPLGG